MRSGAAAPMAAELRFRELERRLAEVERATWQKIGGMWGPLEKSCGFNDSLGDSTRKIYGT